MKQRIDLAKEAPCVSRSKSVGTRATLLARHTISLPTIGLAVLAVGVALHAGLSRGDDRRHAASFDGQRSVERGWVSGFETTGPDDTVSAMVVFDDGTGPALYAGGTFEWVDGTPAGHVACWDGSSWSALTDPFGIGPDGTVYALAVYDDGSGPALFAGGLFTHASGLPAVNIARWDGTSWSAVGSGTSGEHGEWVEALAVFDDGRGPALYAGGWFAQAGGLSVENVARWNGRTWSGLTGSSGTGTVGAVRALGTFDLGDGLQLYAGGGLSSAGGVAANGLARWNGAEWSGLATPTGENGTGYICRALTVHDDGNGPALFVGGSFVTAGGALMHGIARWDGTSWSPLVGPSDAGVRGSVYALTTFNDGGGERLYAGGGIIAAGGIPAHHVARWNGDGWSALEAGFVGAGLDGHVYALELFDDGSGPALFAAGWIASGGGVPLANIGRWDGVAWHALDGPVGDGIDGTVYALAVFDDGAGPALYAGGDFTSAGGLTAYNVARWDGHGWWPLSDSGGTGTNGWVRALAVYNDGSGPALYVSGEFTRAGGQWASSIARWDGSTWSPVGYSDQFDPVGMINALAVHDDGSGEALYAGGDTGRIGGITIHGVARWDGSSWSTVDGPGGGLTGYPYITDLASYPTAGGSVLVVAGGLSSADGHPAGGVAQWDGVEWWPLAGAGGQGTDGWVLDLDVVDDGGRPMLIVAGEFDHAGGVAVNRIARWDGAEWSPLMGGAMGLGLDDDVEAVVGLDDGNVTTIFAGGSFGSAGGLPSSRIAQWTSPSGALFLDGFESSDTSSWSQTVP